MSELPALLIADLQHGLPWCQTTHRSLHAAPGQKGSGVLQAGRSLAAMQARQLTSHMTQLRMHLTVLRLSRKGQLQLPQPPGNVLLLIER